MAGTPAAERSARLVGMVLARGELPARCCSPGATTLPQRAYGHAGAVTRRQKADEHLQNLASSESPYLSLSVISLLLRGLMILGLGDVLFPSHKQEAEARRAEGQGDGHTRDPWPRKCPHLCLSYLKILFSRLSCFKLICIYAEALGYSPNFQERPAWKTSFSLNS